MKRLFLWLMVFLLGLVSEILTSLWLWRSAPTDTIRVWYSGFGSYMMERVPAWLVIFTILGLSVAWFARRLRVT